MIFLRPELQDGIRAETMRAAITLAGQRRDLFLQDAAQANKVCPKLRKPKQKKDRSICTV